LKRGVGTRAGGRGEPSKEKKKGIMKKAKVSRGKGRNRGAFKLSLKRLARKDTRATHIKTKGPLPL